MSFFPDEIPPLKNEWEKLQFAKKMSKYAIAFVLPLSLLAAFSIFSIEKTPKSYAERQYQLNTDEATLIANEDGPLRGAVDCGAR